MFLFLSFVLSRLPLVLVHFPLLLFLLFLVLLLSLVPLLLSRVLVLVLSSLTSSTCKTSSSTCSAFSCFLFFHLFLFFDPNHEEETRCSCTCTTWEGDVDQASTDRRGRRKMRDTRARRKDVSDWTMHEGARTSVEGARWQGSGGFAKMHASKVCDARHALKACSVADVRWLALQLHDSNGQRSKTVHCIPLEAIPLHGTLPLFFGSWTIQP